MSGLSTWERMNSKNSQDEAFIDKFVFLKASLKLGLH